MEEQHVGIAKLPEVRSGPLEHQFSTVYPYHSPFPTNTLGQECSIEATSAAEFKDGLSGFGLGKRDEGGGDSGEGLAQSRRKAIEQGGRIPQIPGILSADPELVAVARRLGDLGVFLSYELADLLRGHFPDLLTVAHMSFPRVRSVSFDTASALIISLL